ncbi:endonuclease/exonuclease/phosphatase family protein [Streptomyces sp. NPDC059785]|uniref:endonuclease/exonuclease/phosphatase family protein n=1 Tax=unclassified Streptomyces TaxID=2593676 RepID=UPI0036518522
MTRTGVFVWGTAAFLVAAVLTVLAVSAPEGSGDAAPAAPRHLRVMQYNLCGAAAHCTWNAGGSGAGTSIERVTARARKFRPDILTVNEICLTQYAALKERLAGAGWRMDGTYASFQDNVPNCGPGGRFGEAVLSRRNVPDDVQDFQAFTHTGGETYTGGGRTVDVRRGLLCAHTEFAGEPLTACTAHAYGGAPGQLREIRDRFLDLPAGRRVVLAGDLNAPPDSPALGFLTPYFTEADRRGGPTAGGRKIDYVFADRSHFATVTGRARTFPESDHALLTGVFRLR